MLHNLVRNAFEAREDAGVEAAVALRVVVGERLCFHILDRGGDGTDIELCLVRDAVGDGA